MKAQIRAYYDYGTAGIVHPLTQQVLTKTTLLALNHICQGLQRALVSTRDGTTATAVIQQCVYRFLKHPLFVTHDNVGSVQLQQALEAVVPVDNPTIQIIEIGGRKTATIQRYQRTQIRWQNRQHGHYHVAGLVARIQESFKNFQTLTEFLDLGFGVGLRYFFTQRIDFRLQFNIFKQLLHGLGTHTGIKLVAKLLQCLVILLIVQQLTALERGHARIDHNERLKVEHTLDISQRHVQHQTDTGRQ